MSQQEKKISEHRIRGIVIFSQFLFLILLLAVGVVAYQSMNTYMTGDVLEMMPSFYQYIPFLPLALAAFMLFRIIKLLTKRVVLYEDGIGNGKQKWAWENISWSQEQIVRYYYLWIIPAGKDHCYSILFDDGKHMNVTHEYTNFKSLSNVLQEVLKSDEEGLAAAD